LSDLGLYQGSETQEASYQAANAWWAAKRAELDAANARTARQPLPLEDLAEVLWGTPGSIPFSTFKTPVGGPAETPLVVAARQTLLDLALGQTIGDTQPIPLDQARENRVWPAVLTVLRQAAADLIREAVVTGKGLPADVIQALPESRVLQVENAVQGVRGEATASPDCTVKAHITVWAQYQQALVRAGQKAPDTVYNTQNRLNMFREFVGAETDISTINESVLSRFYVYCLGRAEKQNWSRVYAQKVFRDARSFIRWLYEQGQIEPLRNLNSRAFPFKVGDPNVETWTPDEFQAAVAATNGILKLVLLLMANTGMTQQDISDLLDTEVDWKAGRITRRRSKTKDNKRTPTVSYPLWPSTFDLLKQHQSGQERVLITETDRPFVRKDQTEQGQYVKCDVLAGYFRKLRDRLRKARPGFNRTLKQLRKLGPSVLDTHSHYYRFKDLFLGHAAGSMAAKHYTAVAQEQFDEAVRWLGQRLGQCP
jgi:integrase